MQLNSLPYSDSSSLVASMFALRGGDSFLVFFALVFSRSSADPDPPTSSTSCPSLRSCSLIAGMALSSSLY